MNALPPLLRTTRVILISIFTVSALAGLGSCHTAPKSLVRESPPQPGTINKSVVVPKVPELTVLAGDSALGTTALKARPMTSYGQNSGPRYSPDGKRLLFLSRQRSNHKQAQVYELTLESMIERRVTFHDGDDTGADYLSDGERIVYASSTDEAKEDPMLVETLRKNFDPKPIPVTTTATPATAAPTAQVVPKPAPPELPSQEIYLQELNGREIERLTRHPGYDGEPSVGPKGNLVVFSSERNGVVSLFLLNIARGLAPTALIHSEGHDSSARISPDGKSLVWSRFAKDRSKARLMFAPSISTAGSIKELTSDDAQGAHLDLHPAWHPNGADIVFASNRGGHGFDLYLLNIESKCLKRLTDLEGDEVEPAFSPDGKKLTFTGTHSGLAQIYAMDFVAPAKCLQ